MRNYLGIMIDNDRNKNLKDYSITMLTEFYLRKGEHVQEGFARAAYAWSDGDMDLAQRLYDYVSKGWFMFASPVLSNAPAKGDKQKKRPGMPISCFLMYVDDSVKGLIDHSSELRYLSIMGGGCGGHWSDVRAVSDIAPGPIPFIHTVDADMTAYKQGKTRKGSYAAYLDISHPDIMEFLSIRVPTGDVGRKALNIHNAVNVTDEFMNAVLEDKEWNLKCPHDGHITDTLKARAVWQKILEVRFRTGEPYINFIDTANAHLPMPLKAKGLKVHGSNLCNEIHLPTSPDRTAVCCLSSLNLEKYDDWKDTQIVRDLITMLDNVLQYFIDKSLDVISRARYSATRERSLGLGAMGFHSLLQSKGIAWESDEARQLNKKIFKFIKSEAVEQTKQLAADKGEYLDGYGSGRRNSHLLAIAPNASSGIILSTSPSIEPLKACAYTHRTRAGSFLVKNKYLEALLDKKNKNTQEIWTDIITKKGSVQHLDFLTDREKNIFKTSFEIDQMWVVKHAGDRQEFICQGQSVNLFFATGAKRCDVNIIHIDAWKQGLKGLYYLRTESKARPETIADKVERVVLKSDTRTIIYGTSVCPYCNFAKALLEQKGEEFEFVDLTQIGKTAAEVTGRDVRSVPQIYFKGEYVGGYTELVEYFKGMNNTTPVIHVEDEDDDGCKSCEG